jgi:DNA mismatch repair protein MutS
MFIYYIFINYLKQSLFTLIEYIYKMEYNKEITVKDYFTIHDYYAAIYGKERTIIVMQVGGFHEVYCNNNQGLKLEQLSQDLDIHLAKKNDNIRMMGFPIHVTSNYIDKLVDMDYTVVVIDQVTEAPNPKRKVTGIYSPATRIEKTSKQANYLVSIVLDRIVSNEKGKYNLCIGLASYDLATGNGMVYETYSTQSDMYKGLDDAVRFLENNPPREIILENNLTNTNIDFNMKLEDIMSYLNIEPGKAYNISIKEHKKIAYQKNMLENIYKIETNIDIMEYMGIAYLNWARYSLIILLDYVKAHQPILLQQIKVPIIFSSNKYLYLGNRALEQLDITKKSDTNLFNIINFTKTSLGKRYLSMQLTMPLINPSELITRYVHIERLLHDNHIDKMSSLMEDIYDLDKLIRKLEISIISPMELYQLYLSLYQINNLNNYMKSNNLTKDFDISSDYIKNTKSIVDTIETTFVLEKINNLSFVNFFESDISFYKPTIHKDIDTIQTSIDSAQNFMVYLIKALENYIVDEKVCFKKNDSEEKSLLTLKYNDRDGHYLMITTRRCDILKKNLAKVKKIKVNTIDIDTSDLEFSELPKSNNTKINCKKIKEISANLVEYKMNMAKKLKETFKLDMNIFLEKYKLLLHDVSNKVAYIDFINSGAICAKTNHYIKPKIILRDSSFFKAKEMRHPIVERISTDTVYVPHNIELGCGTQQDGILLYGINSSGKSTLMKAVGLNIVLAQIGYYTACTEFEFSPYSSLFTRICGNDNMFKGLSSFMVEMMELMAILKRNDKNTLVIGDELAKGTEFRSGIVIVSYMLETLSKSNSSFITATHIHDINKLDSIKSLERVKTKHLKITQDPVNDMLIYERSLLDGQGETFYGLMVAKHMMKDKQFNERTSELLKEYDNINVKVSKYNSNIYMEKCIICENTEKLETHHIVWQKDFNMDNINKSKFHLQKNDSSNLVTLCIKCHDMVDRGEIHVNGWVETSNGKVFDYKINTPDITIKKSKYTPEVVQYIKSLKGVDSKMIRIKIKEKFDMKVSTKSIEKFI